MDEHGHPSDDEERPAKRFKHQSYTASLATVHLPSALSLASSAFTTTDAALSDNDSHFNKALTHWRQLNLSPSFLAFARKADGLSSSVALLLHNWQEIIGLWIISVKDADEEGLLVLLDLLQKITHDLRTTLEPSYSDILAVLLPLLTKPIPAPTLTSLLATFSGLFKYILIPAPALLESTYKSITAVLPKCNTQVQRAMAEVWGSVLRRLKLTGRQQAVGLLADNLQGVDEAAAWTLSFACQSVSQTLHTCTPSILSSLLGNPPNPHTPTLLRRVLTSLIHHVSSATAFAPVSELVLRAFDTKKDDQTVQAVTMIVSVREGSRLSTAQIASVLTSLPSLLSSSGPSSTLLTLTVATLCSSPSATAGGSSLLSPSNVLLTHLWSAPTLTRFTLDLSAALAELNWSGWRSLGLPLLVRGTQHVFASSDEKCAKALSVLAALHQSRKLTANDVDLVWKETISRWVEKRLGSGNEWMRSEANAIELTNILALSSYLPNLSLLLIRIIESTLADNDATASDYSDTFANSSWVLGSCMHTLAQRPTSEWVSLIDLPKWLTASVERYGSWSENVLSGLAALLRISPATEPKLTIPLAKIYPSLSSHSRPLRLATLRLLASPSIASGNTQEVVKRCLQGEEVALDTQGVRERVLRIGRAGLVVGDDNGVDVCARWLIAQLKVNLRPLWSPAAGALAALGSRFGDRVWELVFAELKGINDGSVVAAASSPVWMTTGEDKERRDDDVPDPYDDEKSWRDPSAHAVRSAVVKWTDVDLTRKLIAHGQNTHSRLDINTYEIQLLATFTECASLAEKHNRELVPFFLSLTPPPPRTKLTAWLTLFSKFTNPKALYATEQLHTLYISLLSHPDRSLQVLALSCVLTYKNTHLVAHANTFRALLDDTRWRDEITSDHVDVNAIDVADRGAFVDVLIRVLFGVMLERKGNNSSGKGKSKSRRAAVLGALGQCDENELGLLVDLMLLPLGQDREARREGVFDIGGVGEEVDEVVEKKQVGFLTLLGDVLRAFGPKLVAYWPALVGTTMDLIGNAHAKIANSGEGVVEEDDQLQEDNDDEHKAETAPGSSSSSISKATRSIRQLGLKRLAEFFKSPVHEFDFTPFMPAAFASFISPRLDSLDKENTQAPSALLELFFTWTLRGDHIPFLVDYDSRALPKIYDCLIATNIKPAVISRIFDIVDRLLSFSNIDTGISERVVKPHVSLLLANLAILVERTKDVAAVATPLGQRQISILSEIAQYCTDGQQASMLLSLFSPLLRRPAKLVPEKVKVDLLKIISNVLNLIPELSVRTSAVYIKTYELLAQLFQNLRSRPARVSLVSAFKVFASIDQPLEPLATMLESLNAYSTKRLEEPDFNRRLEVFAALNETHYAALSTMDWLPVIYNMLHCVQDPLELAIRNNAAFALRHFIDFVASSPGPEYEAIFLRVLFPGLKNGLRSKNELVRAEVLSVIAHAVDKCHTKITSLQEMHVLLANGDSEASFFTNVHHIQVHRRSRALRRLAECCEQGQLKSNTLADIFVPLVSNYITSGGTGIDHHLVNEAITTTGVMAGHLAWGAYYALVQKYLKLSRDKSESERVFVRTLVAILDNFHFPMEEEVAVVVEEDDRDAQEPEEDVVVPVIKPTVKNIAKIADAVNIRLLPALLEHLEKHDASTEDSTRIPIAVGIIKVAKHLPAALREPQITRLVTALSQILRSRSQETRDLVRDTLARIAISLGSSSYLAMILKELRTALLRGPQLHVLASITHSLLVHVTTGNHASAFPSLDECVGDVAHVSAEVIFGESGKDVQAEEFKTKMREVRSSASKGFDSFAIMAKHITPAKISALLGPLRSIMHQTESIKVMQLAEEVLKRVASGLNGNTHLVPQELIVLCHTLISQNSKFLKQAPNKRKGSAKGDAIVQTKRYVGNETDHYTNNSFRFVAFGLDLFNTALRRNKFDFKDTAIIARLESMIVVIGNTLYSTSTPVLLHGLKAAGSIVKCPLQNLDKSVPVFVRQILDIVKQAGNTESDVVQTAFKALATMLRDGPTVKVQEKDLVYLLELLSPDLEDHTRQASVFTMLRAIVARKFVVPEIYDLMDKVSEVMVTSQSPSVQELCRGVLLQFLLDYPQGKGRLKNQMTFLAKNLSYVYESGRKSVMELLGAVTSKFEASLVREYSDMIFVALVMVIANDDSPKCREMASNLIKTLITRLDTAQRDTLVEHLRSWAAQHSQPQLVRVSAQVYGLLVDVLQSDCESFTAGILEDINSTLRLSAETLSSLEEADEDNPMSVDLEWQVPYHALLVLSKIIRVFPTYTTTDDKIEWDTVIAHLLFPHAWVRTASCRMLGSLFTAVPIAPPTDDAKNPVFSKQGMQDVAKKLCLQLKSEHLDDALSLQVVKNLFYIGKCFYAVPVPSSAAEADQKQQEEDVDEDGEAVVVNDNADDPLPWLFSKLSYQARSAHIARRNRTFSHASWVHQPSSVLRWFAAMTTHMDAARLEKFLVHILSPVYRIVEDDTIHEAQMEEIKTLAIELQDLVQLRVGTTKFANTYNQIRQSVLGVRRDRKAARVMQATTNPEAAAKRKLQRNTIKKDSRKRKSRTFADGKGRIEKRRRDE